jgi:ArsR family transcriptional regulator
MKYHIYDISYVLCILSKSIALITALSFYKCLSEETRLKSLLLIVLEGELCVCDLVEAFQLSQPKVSRHLAELRKCGILVDKRRGKWVFYQLAPTLPAWALHVLQHTAQQNGDYLDSCLTNLKLAKDTSSCC